MASPTPTPVSTLEDAAAYILTLPLDVSVVGSILGLVCVLSAVFGNGLIIATVLRVKRLRQRQNVFVVCMAASELVTVFCRDIFMLGTYMSQRFVFGSSLAAGLSVISICRDAIAVGHIVAITVYRYALIVHPRAFAFISKTGFMVFVELIVILFPLGAAIATVDGLTTSVFYYNTKGMRPLSESNLKEAIRYNGTVPEDGPNPLVIVFGYLMINVAILAVCYIHIYVFIQRSKRRLQTWTADQTTAEGAKPDKRKANNAKEVKFVKTMAIVFVTFVLSYFWTPILSAIDREISWSHWVYFPFVMLNWFSSSINWVVYGLTHPAFNQGFRRVLGIRARGNSVADQSVTGDNSVAGDKSASKE